MLRTILIVILICTFAQARSESRLEKQGTATRLIVDDAPYIITPYIIIGGETGNSMGSSTADVSECIAKAKAHGYNTVLFPVSWELIEPEKGKFDFATVDDIISQASAEELKVVFVWFGAWKNSMSCYAPEWFKRDTKFYPRARTASGKPLEIASAFSKNVFDADAKAFTSLLRHIKETDKSGTVIMLQVENEIGMLEDARDHSDLANAAYNKGVPAELVSHLKKYKKSLHPQLLSKWQKAGMKQSGSWTEVFGDDIFTDEIFMAYYYAKYVEGLAQIARSIFPDMPLYVNAAMNSRGRLPGEYPSAGPLAHLKDIWHAAAPTINFLSPDLYDSGFTSWVATYALPDNPLFIPEIKATPANSAQAYYVIGEHNAIGLSPFAFNLRPEADYEYQRKGNETLQSLTPVIARHLGKGTMNGFYFDSDSVSRTIERDGVRIKASHYFTLPWDPRATDGSPWKPVGGLIINISPLEYIVAGSGLVLTFEPALSKAPTTTAILGEDGFALTPTAKSSDKSDTFHKSDSSDKSDKSDPSDSSDSPFPRLGLASVTEVSVSPDGALHRIRTFNGDETHQGRHIRIGVDDFKILHVKLYEYE